MWLGVFIWGGGFVPIRILTLDREANRIIERNLRRNRNLKLISGLSLLCLSIYTIVFETANMPERTAILVAILFLLVGMVGLYFLLHALLRYDSQRNHVLQRLNEQPDGVAWVYYESIQHFPFGIQFLQINIIHIRMVNQEHISMMMREEELLELMRMLRREIPSASFGYSVYKEQLYNINPDLLINMKEHKN